MQPLTASHARALLCAAGLSVCDNGAILSDGAIVRSLPVTEGGQIAKPEFLALVAWIGCIHPDRAALVASYARRIHPDDLGVLGLAIKTAPTLRASLQLLERFAVLAAGGAEYFLEETDGGAWLTVEAEAAADPHVACGLLNECTLAGTLQIMRCVVGSGLHAERISFRHGCVGDVNLYAEVFGCPVQFGRERNAIALSEPMLDLPNRLGFGTVCSFLTRHLEEEADALRGGEPLRERLLATVAEALATGVPRASDIARSMGMSERTLYRRLANEGLTYRQVLQEAQIALARKLLADSDFSIAEIASRTGFSEQSSFGRAFKREVGHTPGRYRSQDMHA